MRGKSNRVPEISILFWSLISTFIWSLINSRNMVIFEFALLSCEQACDRLLAQRVGIKMKSSKVNDVINRLHIAQPSERDAKVIGLVFFIVISMKSLSVKEEHWLKGMQEWLTKSARDDSKFWDLLVPNTYFSLLLLLLVSTMMILVLMLMMERRGG